MDQYTCNFVCTYMQIDDDDLYRIQLLQALNIQVTDALATSVDALFEDIGEHFKPALEAVRSDSSRFCRYLLLFGASASDKDVFSILFSMDLFQYTHACICDLRRQERITEPNLHNLLRACIKPPE